MNPILLKPEATGGVQVIVQGRGVGNALGARLLWPSRPLFCPACCESFRRLAGTADLVVVEGAGCPAEVNLRDGDLANMGFARACRRPRRPDRRHRSRRRDRLAGRHVRSADPADAALIGASLVNNFHGDPTLFDDGEYTSSRSAPAYPCLGVVPHLMRCRAGCLPRTPRARQHAAGDQRTARSRSPCRACRASPISMISIP